MRRKNILTLLDREVVGQEVKTESASVARWLFFREVLTRKAHQGQHIYMQLAYQSIDEDEVP